MQIDLRTVTIKPLRHTFDHIARYLGTDKPVSRYLEGSIGIQPKDIFHYRPTWEPEREIFDEGRTKIRMKDWDALKDPRQFYYGAYTSARARQQDTAEANFDFVEVREKRRWWCVQGRRVKKSRGMCRTASSVRRMCSRSTAAAASASRRKAASNRA
jgi:hypothetical protein